MKRKYILYIFLLSFLSVAAESKQIDSVGTFDRGIGKYNSCFIPKGTISSGVTFAYNNFSIGHGSNDIGYSMLFSMISGLKGEVMGVNVSPFVSYFIKDNLSVGLRFNYDRDAVNVDGVKLSISDDMGIEIQDYNFLTQSYTGSLTLRNYIPINNSKRFAIFAEVKATGGYGQGENYQLEGSEKYGTYQDIYKFELGLVPGLCVFITNDVAAEVSIGLLGFNYQKVAQVTNQVEYSEMEKSGANFKINLLALNFGITFNILPQRFRK